MKKTVITMALASAVFAGHAAAATGTTSALDVFKANGRFGTGDDVMLVGNKLQGIHGAEVRVLDPNTHPKGMFRVDHADGTKTYHTSSTKLNVLKSNGRPSGTVSDGGKFDGTTPVIPASNVPPKRTQQPKEDNSHVFVDNTTVHSPATPENNEKHELHDLSKAASQDFGFYGEGEVQRKDASAPTATAATAAPQITTPSATQPNQQLVNVASPADANQKYQKFQDSAIASNTAKIDANAQELKSLREDLDEQAKRMNGVGALAAANAQLIQPYNVGSVNVTVGFGNYEGANAVALGSGMRINEQWTVRASASFEDATESMAFGAGAAYEF